MSDVFVVSSCKDKARVAILVEALRRAGLSVWWEGDLGLGEHRQQRMTVEFESAKCVVAVWTKASVETAEELVQDMAARAKARGILLPIRLDRVAEPLGFGQIRSLDLVQWNGRPRKRRFRIAAVMASSIVSGKPHPQTQETRSFRLWLVGAAVSLAFLLPVMSFFSDAHELLAPVCQIRGVRAVCSTLRMGGVPTPEEEAAWTSRIRGDCSALRDHLTRFTDGAYAEEAAHLLQALRTESVGSWRAEERLLPLTIRVGNDFHPTQEAAQKDALARSGEDAAIACAGYEAGGYRLRAATAKVVKWQCSHSQGGFICGFDGQAVCQVDILTHEQREVCP